MSAREPAALVLAHRSALDVLDKVAVLANHHFALGEKPKRVDFPSLLRTWLALASARPPQRRPHRFVVLHDEHGEQSARDAPEIERYGVEAFEREVLDGLRVARSAIQALTFAIRRSDPQGGHALTRPYGTTTQ